MKHENKNVSNNQLWKYSLQSKQILFIALNADVNELFDFFVTNHNHIKPLRLVRKKKFTNLIL